MSVFSSDTLQDLYRYTLLLTGSAEAAEALLAETLRQHTPQLNQIRNEQGRRASMVMKLRGSAATPARANFDAEVFPSDIGQLARDFFRLSEPGRTALALSSLSLFRAEEIARLLDCKLVELGAALRGARVELTTLRQESAAVQPGSVV